MPAVIWDAAGATPGGAWALSSGDTVATESSSASTGIKAGVGKSAGKFYFEVVASVDTSFNACVGFCPIGAAPAQFPIGGYILRSSGSAQALPATAFAPGANIGFAIDADAGRVWYRIDGGAWNGGGDPAADTTPTATGLPSSTTWVPCAGSDNNAGVHVFTLKATAGSFTYAAPGGFDALGVAYTLSGTVRDTAGALAARRVLAYLRSTGALVGSTTSDGTTGAFSISATVGDEHVVVALPGDAETTTNALVFDRVLPAVT